MINTVVRDSQKELQEKVESPKDIQVERSGRSKKSNKDSHDLLSEILLIFSKGNPPFSQILIHTIF